MVDSSADFAGTTYRSFEPRSTNVNTGGLSPSYDLRPRVARPRERDPGQNGSEGTQRRHASEPVGAGPLQLIPTRTGVLGTYRAPPPRCPCPLRLSAAALAVNNLLHKSEKTLLRQPATACSNQSMIAKTVTPKIAKSVQRTGNGMLFSIPYDWMKSPSPPPTTMKTGRNNFGRRGLFHASKSVERRRERSLVRIPDTVSFYEGSQFKFYITQTKVV
jgi:hypothetical protein